MDKDLDKVLDEELKGLLNDDFKKNINDDDNDEPNFKKYIKYLVIAVPVLMLMIYFLVGMDFSNNSLTTDEKMYEVYSLASQSGFDGTYEEWLESVAAVEIELKIFGTQVMWKYLEHETWHVLYDMADYKGAQGETGAQGEQGLSALDVWIAINGEGSADDFFDSLNIYALWLAQGNTGSEEEFFASLKGEQGDTGSQGANGEDGKDGADGEDVSYALYLIYSSLGYTGSFNEWKTEYVGKDANDQPGDFEFDFGLDKEEFTVSFKVKENIFSTQTVEDGSKLTAPETPVLENYIFDGWYVGDEKWSFIGFTVTQDIELVAIFTPVEYTISYDLVGGVNNVNNPTTINVENSITLLNPTKEGHTFDGWKNNGSYVTEVTFQNYTSLVAEWTINSYTVTYSDVVNGNVDNADIETSFQLVDASKNGYTFVGWYDSSDRLVRTLSNITSDIHLTAKWNVITYPITYNLNGGLNLYYNQYSITIEDTIALNDAYKQYYTFSGWYENSSCTGTSITSLTNISRDVTLYAKWTAVSYSIEYYLNEGEATNVSSLTVEDTIVLNAASKNYYEFNGWYQEEYFINEVTTLSLDLLVDNKITLYANYKLEIKTDSENNKYVYYGRYPQSVISDTTGLEKGVDYVEINSKQSFESDDPGKTYNVAIEPVRWNVVEQSNGILSLVAATVLDCSVFDGTEITYFENSDLHEFLNADMYEEMFNQEEKTNLIPLFSSVYSYVSVPTKEQYENNKSFYSYSGYSNYAILNGLNLTQQGIVFQWLSSVDSSKVYLANSNDVISSDTTLNNLHGVRPAIMLSY